LREKGKVLNTMMPSTSYVSGKKPLVSLQSRLFEAKIADFTSHRTERGKFNAKAERNRDAELIFEHNLVILK